MVGIPLVSRHCGNGASDLYMGTVAVICMGALAVICMGTVAVICMGALAAICMARAVERVLERRKGGGGLMP